MKKSCIHIPRFKLSGLLLLPLICLLLVSCKKDFIEQNNETVLTKDQIFAKMNYSLPDMEPSEKVKKLRNFRENIESFKNSLKSVTYGVSASYARWEMETYINNTYAGVEPGELERDFGYDTIYFEIENDSISIINGEPYLNPYSHFTQYLMIEAIIQAINETDYPLSLFILQVFNFDQDATYFEAIIITENGEYQINAGNNCLLPVNIVPFESGEFYYAGPTTFYPYVGANQKIEQKINSNFFWFDDTYLIEVIGPPYHTSWTTNNDPLWWHGTYNDLLYTAHLNLYLNNYYYDVLIGIWQPNYGANDIYVHHCRVHFYDGWDPDNCYPYPCPTFASPPNSTNYCWHYMVGFKLRATYIGLIE